MLALNAATTVSADRLMEGLWGEQLPPTAAKTLRAHVSRLRRALEASGDGTAIVTRAHGYELRLAPEDVDARRFERLVEHGAPREALALWRGRALEDVAGEPFAAAEIRRLEALRQAAIEQAVEADLAVGRHRELIGELEALVADEPYRERLRGQLMLALYRSGRQADALAAYRDARAGLVEQIGVEPGEELQRMHEAILRHDPALAYDGAPGGDDAVVMCPFKGLASFDVEDAAVFFGRERLVSEAIARLAGSSLLGLVGPSGCGKSSVLRAGLLAALARGALPGSERWPIVLIRPGTRALEQAKDARLILAVDQFEELFARGVAESERAAFVDALVERAGDERRRTLVLVALRADFYGRCAAYPELAALLSAGHLLVGPMRRDELRRAIELPARGAGMTVEPQLVEALLDDVAGEPGALPLLSASLLELWKNRNGHELRMDAYERRLTLMLTDESGVPDTLEVRDVESRRVVARVPISDNTNAVRFSPDGRLIAVGNYNGRAQVWSTATWKPVSPSIGGHAGALNGAAISRDGTMLATGGDDGMVRLWDIKTGRALGAPLPGVVRQTVVPSFTADGTHLLAAYETGDAYLWDIRPESLVRQACRVAGRRLTRPEWAEFLPGRDYEPAC